jgi:hypothetical protein
MRKYAFFDVSGLVVQCFVANIDQSQLDQFMSDYYKLFNVTGVVSFDESSPVWLGWTIVDGVPVEPAQVQVSPTQSDQIVEITE